MKTIELPMTIEEAAQHNLRVDLAALDALEGDNYEAGWDKGCTEVNSGDWTPRMVRVFLATNQQRLDNSYGQGYADALQTPAGQ